MEPVPARERSIPAWATLVIRLALGVVFIAHGSQKVFGAFGGHGMDGTIGMVRSLGFPLPVMFAWFAALAEFLGGIGVFVGLLTRFAAAGIAITMVVAITRVHLKGGFFAPRGFEYPLVLLAMALSLIFSGAGKISLDWLAHRVLRRESRSPEGG